MTSTKSPRDPAWQALAEPYPDAYAVSPTGREHTYSAADPVRRIDGVFVDASIEVVECGVPGVPDVHDIERASDHRPVLAVLRLPSDDGAVV